MRVPFVLLLLYAIAVKGSSHDKPAEVCTCSQLNPTSDGLDPGEPGKQEFKPHLEYGTDGCTVSASCESDKPTIACVFLPGQEGMCSAVSDATEPNQLTFVNFVCRGGQWRIASYPDVDIINNVYCIGEKPTNVGRTTPTTQGYPCNCPNLDTTSDGLATPATGLQELAPHVQYSPDRCTASAVCQGYGPLTECVFIKGHKGECTAMDSRTHAGAQTTAVNFDCAYDNEWVLTANPFTIVENNVYCISAPGEGESETTSSSPPSTSTTQSTTTEPATTTEPTVAEIVDLCDCEGAYDRIWLDVVLVIDSSSDMTANGLDNAWGLVNSPLYSMSFGRDPYQSRVGVVVYADDVQIVKDLDDIQSGDDVDGIRVPYLGGEGNNLRGAIQTASEMLDNEVPGRNARRVIVIITSSYDDSGADDPRQVASQFRHSGGVIMTIEYMQPGDDHIPKLAELATPGYVFRNDQINVVDQLEAFCQANCFCRSSLTAYSSDDRGAPDGGCFEHVNAPAIYRSAMNSCKEKQSTLVSIHDQRKQDFVHSLAGTQAQIWIGLQKNIASGTYEWIDGQSSSYSHWGPGQPGTDTCVFSQQYQTTASGWFTANCVLKSYQYQCESRPCSAKNYCYAQAPKHTDL